MTIAESITTFSNQLGTEGGKNYAYLVHAISQEIGLILAFLQDAQTTAGIQTLQGTEFFEEAVDTLFKKYKLTEEIESLETDIHKRIAKLFKQYKDKAEYFQNPIVDITKENQ